MSLSIFEIYRSIQGESTHAGRPCTFIRLAACDLRCTWCDTAYAFTGGRRMDLDAIMTEVETLDCPLVEITGGEPLLQEGVYALIERLLEDGHEVLIETGGHRSIERLPAAAIAIVDVKCPASGEAAKMHWPNLELLRPDDEVKFVIQDRADFDYACDVVAKYALDRRGRAVLFSPSFGKLAPAELARWMLEDGVHARLQLQQHKYIWPPDARGV